MEGGREPPGSAEAFGLAPLIQRYRGRLEATVRRRIDPALGARLDAEGIVQEALVRAASIWRESGPPAISAMAWLYRLTLDALTAAWRRETAGLRDARRDLPWPEHSSVQLGLGLAAALTTPSGAVARQEVRGRVHEALGRLGDADREVLWMRHFDEMDYREIGEVLGISENAATIPRSSGSSTWWRASRPSGARRPSRGSSASGCRRIGTAGPRQAGSWPGRRPGPVSTPGSRPRPPPSSPGWMPN